MAVVGESWTHVTWCVLRAVSGGGLRGDEGQTRPLQRVRVRQGMQLSVESEGVCMCTGTGMCTAAPTNT